MARRFSKCAGKDVERRMRAFKQGKLKSGPGGMKGKFKNRRQAIAIDLSEARKEGKEAPKEPAERRKKRGGGRKKKSSTRKQRSSRR